MGRREANKGCAGVFMSLDCYQRLDGWIAGQKGLVAVSESGKKEL